MQLLFYANYSLYASVLLVTCLDRLIISMIAESRLVLEDDLYKLYKTHSKIYCGIKTIHLKNNLVLLSQVVMDYSVALPDSAQVSWLLSLWVLKHVSYQEGSGLCLARCVTSTVITELKGVSPVSSLL